jgi:hypothetical protein
VKEVLTMNNKGEETQAVAQAKASEVEEALEAQVAREHYNRIMREKRERFVSRFVDRADDERQWENLLARRGIGR